MKETWLIQFSWRVVSFLRGFGPSSWGQLWPQVQWSHRDKTHNSRWGLQLPVCWVYKKTIKCLLLLGSPYLNNLTTYSKNNRITNSHNHWYLLCAFVLLKAQCVISIFDCLVNRQVWSTKTSANRQERWTETHPLNASHCQAVQILLYALILYVIHCQHCHAALEN